MYGRINRKARSATLFWLGLSLLVTLPSITQAQDLALNGSFESGVDPGFFLSQLPVGNASIDDWAIVADDIDYIGTAWTAADGARSIDLRGGPGAGGAISQTFATEVGVEYRVLFDLAGNPSSGPTVKQLEVSGSGALETYDFDITGRTLVDMGWQTREFAFTAASTSTTLTFRSLTTTGYGPALDHVRIHAISLGDPTLAELEALIQTHGPVFEFDVGELFFPDDPTPSLNASSLRTYTIPPEPPTLLANWSRGANSILDDVQPLLEEPAANSASYRYLLDWDPAMQSGSLPLSAGDLTRAKAYVRAQPFEPGAAPCLNPNDCVEIQFWLYYPWNGPGKAQADCGIISLGDFDPTGTAGQHYSDWEHVRVRVQRDQGSGSSIVNVLASRHSEDCCWENPSTSTCSPNPIPGCNATSTLDLDAESHPIVYVARDSHANYFTDQRTLYLYASSTDLGVCSLDVDLYDLPRGAGAQLAAHDPARYELVSTAWPEVATTTEDWLFFAGQWGEFQSVGFDLDINFDPPFCFPFCINETIEVFDELQNGKPGLIERSAWDVTCPANANLGSLRFVDATASPNVPEPVGTLWPTFDPNNTSYALVTDPSVTALRVLPQAVNHDTGIEWRLNGGPYSCLDGTGCTATPTGALLGKATPALNLPVGANTIEIQATISGCSTTSKTYTVAVPEPGSLALLASGVLMLGLFASRRVRAN